MILFFISGRFGFKLDEYNDLRIKIFECTFDDSNCDLEFDLQHGSADFIYSDQEIIDDYSITDVTSISIDFVAVVVNLK